MILNNKYIYCVYTYMCMDTHIHMGLYFSVGTPEGEAAQVGF